MPLYEYQCEACGSVFEKMQKFSDEPLRVHEDCGGAVHRLLSAPALQFKGSGWYITDYARGGGKPADSNGEKKATPDDKGGSSTKSDSTTKSDAPASKPAASTTTPKSDK